VGSWRGWGRWWIWREKGGVMWRELAAGGGGEGVEDPGEKGEIVEAGGGDE
jgi:hypothetical protein